MTVNAVPCASWLSSTMSGSSSASARSSVSDAQMTPEVCCRKNAIFSGVAASRGHDQVALVLAVLVVGDDDDLTSPTASTASSMVPDINPRSSVQQTELNSNCMHVARAQPVESKAKSRRQAVVLSGRRSSSQRRLTWHEPRTLGRGAGSAPRASSRSKRDEIVLVAADYFGRQGYEDTKWADVAAAVGVGSTALYHYFESKLHCLYVIMAEAIEAFRHDFDRAIAENDDFETALREVLRAQFDLTEQEVHRNRVLVAEQGLVGVKRTSPREEEARELARARTRDLEVAWATFLARGMQQGVLPENDPQLMSRAVLGLYNSVWHWYRPRGILSLETSRDFFVPRQLAMLGLPSRSRAPRLLKPGGERG